MRISQNSASPLVASSNMWTNVTKMVNHSWIVPAMGMKRKGREFAFLVHPILLCIKKSPLVMILRLTFRIMGLLIPSMMTRAMSTSVMRVHSCLSSTTLRRIVESLI